MKLVTAIIQPHRLDEVKKAVMAEGVKGMTVSQVNGYGRQRATQRFTAVRSTRWISSPKSRSNLCVPTIRPQNWH